MQLELEYIKTCGGTTGSGCGHRHVKMESSGGLNTDGMLAVVRSSSRGHRLGKVSNRAGEMAVSSNSSGARCGCLRIASGRGSIVNIVGEV